MKVKITITILALFLSISLYSQNGVSAKNLIHTIDSIVIANQIELVTVYQHEVTTSSMKEVDTQRSVLVNKEKFKFVDEFLKTDKYYINMQKLRYFKITNSKILIIYI